MIVDGDVHLWDVDVNPQPWITDDSSPLARTFGPDELQPLLAAGGIDSVIAVQGACLDSDTDYLFAVAAAYEWVGAVTAWVDLLDRRTAEARLDQLAGVGKLRAVRHLVNIEDDDHWLLRPEVLESLDLLVEERGLILEVPVEFPRHFGDVGLLAARFPKLRIVVDHLGKPPLATPSMPAWETELRALAPFQNVYAKVSGLGTTLPTQDWHARMTCGRPSRSALDAFGAERLLWGSDWPVAVLNGSYERVWAATREVVSATAGAGAVDIFGGTATRLYALEVGRMS